mmetsp:Transcript_22422/g.62173  ORF Transcript_22422/g.62173 Transcript_22422/m.62173 type:complete len:228 (-) Transcript_22422:206-889(-)
MKGMRNVPPSSPSSPGSSATRTVSYTPVPSYTSTTCPMVFPVSSRTTFLSMRSCTYTSSSSSSGRSCLLTSIVYLDSSSACSLEVTSFSLTSHSSRPLLSVILPPVRFTLLMRSLPLRRPAEGALMYLTPGLSKRCSGKSVLGITFSSPRTPCAPEICPISTSSSSNASPLNSSGRAWHCHCLHRGRSAFAPLLRWWLELMPISLHQGVLERHLRKTSCPRRGSLAG